MVSYHFLHVNTALFENNRITNHEHFIVKDSIPFTIQPELQLMFYNEYPRYFPK